MRRIRRGGDRRQVNTNTRSSIYEEPLLPRAASRSGRSRGLFHQLSLVSFFSVCFHSCVCGGFRLRRALLAVLLTLRPTTS